MELITIVGCVDLDAMVAFFVDECGARVDSISPADAPRDVTVSLGGSSICLRRSDHDDAVSFVVRGTADPVVRRAPNGSIVEFRSDSTDVLVPPVVPSLSIVGAGEEFGTGRAGMGYRDLLPDRWGGAFIASHIRIADGGDVADYVHYHRIRFQMIFCARGWVDLVYEDQGEPFRLEAGDCVLQPPGIRHRVLRSSPGLEVIEIGCPAVHDTLAEHEVTLPTGIVDAGRDFGGQRFVRHIAADAERAAHLQPGLAVRDTGIGVATGGLAGAVVVEAVQSSAGAEAQPLTHDGEFAFVVVLDGSGTLDVDAGGTGNDVTTAVVGPFHAVALPPKATWVWSNWTHDFEFLEVVLPSGSIRRSRPDAVASASELRR
jgi:quercetin dioxygenase-like cupin family protein